MKFGGHLAYSISSVFEFSEMSLYLGYSHNRSGQGIFGWLKFSARSLPNNS